MPPLGADQTHAARAVAERIEFPMSRLLAKKKAGFTLLELMIVVAILGILAAVAIPAFMTYIKRSRTAEANVNVEKMFTGAATYYAKDYVAGQTVVSVVSTMCIAPGSLALSPADPGPQKQAFVPDANAQAIGFTIQDPVYFGYAFESVGAGCAATNPTAGYTFYANGDLDGDQTNSRFAQAATVAPSGTAGFEMAKAGALYVDAELE